MSGAPATVQPADPCEPLCAVTLTSENSALPLVACTATGEAANFITHGLGLLLSVAASVVLMVAARHGDVWQQLACGIYAGTMVSVYATSTLSHLFREPRRQLFFRMLDQGCIYLFIVGTFTPIAATFLRTAIGGFYCPPCGPLLWRAF